MHPRYIYFYNLKLKSLKETVYSLTLIQPDMSYLFKLCIEG